MKIFITGGTGFLGSHFINEAHEKSHEVMCLRRKGSKSGIKLFREPIWLTGELSNDWTEELRKCDAFVHLAAHGVSKDACYEKLIKINILDSTKILSSAIHAGIKKFIIIGSYWEYGNSAKRYTFVPPSASLLPTNAYAATKASFCLISNQLAIKHKLKLQNLKIGQIYGEGESPNRLWPSLRDAAIKGKDFQLSLGEQIRDFTPVKFAAKKIINYLDFKHVKEGIPITRNIGTGREQSLYEFASYWWKKWNATGKLCFGSIPYKDDEIIRFVPKVYEGSN